MEHVPVFLEEVKAMLPIKATGTYADLTMGRGGHAAVLLPSLTSGQFIGFDQDKAAIDALKPLQQQFPCLQLVHDNFVHAGDHFSTLGIEHVDGVLMDLGVSSPQFDTPERGFSYRFDGPLDMRMDQRQSLTAASILATYDVRQLTHIFSAYADETFAYPIAKAIVNRRSQKPITTTFELVELIKQTKPKKALQKKGHPAKQVFQALRMEVNQELQRLEATLNALKPWMALGGRIGVISFHSTEDRLVKSIFRSWTVIEGDRHGPALRPQDIPTPTFKEIKPYPVKPSLEEMNRNPRSESATFRVVERIAYEA